MQHLAVPGLLEARKDTRNSITKRLQAGEPTSGGCRGRLDTEVIVSTQPGQTVEASRRLCHGRVREAASSRRPNLLVSEPAAWPFGNRENSWVDRKLETAAEGGLRSG